MLPAVVKLCCGISYPHLRNMAGLQRAAVAVIGQEITHLQRWGWSQHLAGATAEFQYNKSSHEAVNQMKDQLIYVKQGQEALRKATRILENKDGWNVEITESNGDAIYSKVMPGGRRVFRLESVLEADVDELYDILFLRVEEMHKWNPSIQQIKVLKRVGPETVVTHEVSAQTGGNLIGQRDFVSVRHSCKHKTHVYLGGAAIQLESFPPLAGFVRAEDGPTCILIRALGAGKTHFTWLLNMDIKRKQTLNAHVEPKRRACDVMVLHISWLAAKIHCQSGFAPSTAGFYPTSAEASHSERMPKVTERAPEPAAAAASAPCYLQRNHGKPDKTLEEIGPEGIMVWNYRN